MLASHLLDDGDLWYGIRCPGVIVVGRFDAACGHSIVWLPSVRCAPVRHALTGSPPVSLSTPHAGRPRGDSAVLCLHLRERCDLTLRWVPRKGHL